MAKYGIPYMGSKGPIADWVISNLPAADNFYDLFGGGFSVTHAAMLHGKWSNFHFNEISHGVCDLIKSAIAGRYSYRNFKPKFVTREDFSSKKDTCAYTRCIWSFGNNQRNYLFGKKIEHLKHALHDAVVFDDFNETAVELIGFDKWPEGMADVKEKRLLCRKIMKDKGLQQLERLQQLQQLERLQQLEQLERLQQLEFSDVDYRLVNIKPNSIIYCDIPYKGTAKYSKDGFDHDAFYHWALTSRHPVFISEYAMPSEFTALSGKKKAQKLSPSKNRKVFIEKIFANPAALDMSESFPLSGGL